MDPSAGRSSGGGGQLSMFHTEKKRNRAGSRDHAFELETRSRQQSGELFHRTFAAAFQQAQHHDVQELARAGYARRCDALLGDEQPSAVRHRRLNVAQDAKRVLVIPIM